MNRLVKMSLELEQKRKDLGALLDATEEEQRMECFEGRVEEAKAAISAAQTAQATAALAEPEVTETREKTSEGQEIRQLMGRANPGEYFRASLSHRGVGGAEAELNAALGLREIEFPMEMLLTSEQRAAIDGDADTSQKTWLDALFHDAMSERLGIMRPSVPPGIQAYPVTTSGPASGQRARAEAQAAGTLAVTVKELKPTRQTAVGSYQVEDDMRLPGLSDAMLRHMRNQVVENIDKTIFLGDTTASGTEADIAGLNTRSGVDELTVTQAQKIKGDETVKKLATLIDGLYCASPADMNIVAAEGWNTLLLGTIHNSAASNETVGQFLRANGFNWSTRGDIATGSGNNAFLAFISLARGLDGAGVAPVWQASTLITDIYTGAASGTVTLTLHYQWAFDLVRPANFHRLKAVT